MRHILNMGGSALELNALFLQPTRWCALNCKDCYVKDHEGGEDSYHINSAVWSLLLDEIFCLDNIYTNQVTISLDNHHTDLDKSEYMQRVFEAAIYHKNISKKDTELHFTVHDLQTFTQYLTRMKKKFAGIHIIDNIDMLSVSSVNTNQLALFTELKTKFNYNHMPPLNVSSKNINKYIENIELIGKAADHIYMLITKSPMGISRNKLSQVADSQRMRSDIAYINTVLKNVSPNVRRKITVDGCLQDTRKFIKTGFGCSSNVSRFQVWPDGSVTGCPYAFRGGPKTARTTKDILDNIRRARDTYDFRSICTLPTDYNYSIRRPKNSGPQVQDRRSILPIIS